MNLISGICLASAALIPFRGTLFFKKFAVGHNLFLIRVPLKKKRQEGVKIRCYERGCIAKRKIFKGIEIVPYAWEEKEADFKNVSEIS